MAKLDSIVALVAATAVTGCSFAFTKGPPSTPTAVPGAAVQALPPDCTTSMAWPIADSGIAIAGLLFAIGAGNDENRTDDEQGNDVAAGLLVAGVAIAGAFVGRGRVRRCRSAQESYALTYAPNGQPTYGGYPTQPAYPGYPAQPAYGTQPYGTQPYYPPQPQPQPQPAYPPPAPVADPVVKPPIPAPKPVAKPQPRPVAKPQPKPDPSLGTEGDVCATQAECAAGYACTDNVCLKAP